MTPASRRCVFVVLLERGVGCAAVCHEGVRRLPPNLVFDGVLAVRDRSEGWTGGVPC